MKKCIPKLNKKKLEKSSKKMGYVAHTNFEKVVAESMKSRPSVTPPSTPTKSHRPATPINLSKPSTPALHIPASNKINSPSRPSTPKPTKPSITPPIPITLDSKRAILIGLNYPGTNCSLSGCVNDVRNGEQFLRERGYSTKALIDKDLTKQYNVLEALKELRDDPAKTMVFHYSGHGTQNKDLSRDEVDGYDEVVYSNNGVIVKDDDINLVLASFPENKRVILIMDCCHSGSIADLKHTLSEIQKSRAIAQKSPKEVKAKVICISGCRDNSVSADITSGGVSYGALSKTLYDVLKNTSGLTWSQLYYVLLGEMKKKKYGQIPQLSVSDPSLFDSLVTF